MANFFRLGTQGVESVSFSEMLKGKKVRALVFTPESFVFKEKFFSDSQRTLITFLSRFSGYKLDEAEKKVSECANQGNPFESLLPEKKGGLDQWYSEIARLADPGRYGLQDDEVKKAIENIQDRYSLIILYRGEKELAEAILKAVGLPLGWFNWCHCPHGTDERMLEYLEKDVPLPMAVVFGRILTSDISPFLRTAIGGYQVAERDDFLFALTYFAGVVPRATSRIK